MPNRFAALYDDADNDAWTGVLPADPGATHLFEAPVYDRGAAFLFALQQTIGDAAFNTLVRQWAARSVNAPATTDDFKALAEQVSGKQLDDLFQQWLYTPGRPADPRTGSSTAADAAVVARTAATADASSGSGAADAGGSAADAADGNAPVADAPAAADGAPALAVGSPPPHRRR